MRPPLTHLQSQQSTYLLVGHKSGLQKVALFSLPSVEWCSGQEMSGALPGGKEQALSSHSITSLQPSALHLGSWGQEALEPAC